VEQLDGREDFQGCLDPTSDEGLGTVVCPLALLFDVLMDDGRQDLAA
jgi:hypothetical protein